MHLSDLVYELDSSCIAREPSEIRLGRRGLDRMLCVDRQHQRLTDEYVVDLPAILSSGDVVVANDSRRAPGVLFAEYADGGQVELRIVKQDSPHTFLARVFPMHFASPGAMLLAGRHVLRIEDGPLGPHELYKLSSIDALKVVLQAHGLPITSFFCDGYFELANYNPFYACAEGSFESPMAGLHLSEEIVAELRLKGIDFVTLTHHVVGSWLAPLEEEIDAMTMAEESFTIPESTAAAIRRAKSSNKRILAVGSTCVRALESACGDDGVPAAGTATTSLCIRPGFRFRCVDAYLTSFHTARSSLMVLDAAFCGVGLLQTAYRHANRERYMFLEFGDAVLYL